MQCLPDRRLLVDDGIPARRQSEAPSVADEPGQRVAVETEAGGIRGREDAVAGDEVQVHAVEDLSIRAPGATGSHPGVDDANRTHEGVDGSAAPECSTAAERDRRR